jgi:hypothetical protein
VTNEQHFDITGSMATAQASFGHSSRENSMSEAHKDAPRLMYRLTIRLALFVIFTWTGIISAEGANPPSEIGIFQPLQTKITDTIKVQIYVYNRTEKPQAYEGDVIDENGKLILSSGWDIILEEVKNNQTISSRSLRTRNFPSVLHHLEANKFDHWDWHVSVSDLADHPGNYRFHLKYKHLNHIGQLFRVMENFKTPEYIETAYIPDKQTYFMGEPINLKFKIRNNGTDDFLFETGGDYRGATRHLRFYFTAANEKGVEAVDPKPNQTCMGGIGGIITLKPGENHEIELPLLAYLSFPAPGTYTIKGYQDLGFGEPDSTITKTDEYGLGWKQSYGGTFKLTIRTPRPEEMKELIRTQLDIKDRYERRKGLSFLGNPIYLKSLLNALENESDERNIEALLAGVGSILTTESTRHLIKLTEDERTAVRTHALQQLFQRIPPKPNPKLSEERQIPRWKQHEIELAWNESFRSQLTEPLKKCLKSSSLEELAAAANCVALMGNPKRILLLAEAAERLAPEIPVAEENARVVNQLAGAAYSLYDYGFEPIKVNKNSSPGRLAVWADSVLRHREKHNEQWEDLVLHMMNLDCSLTQYHAIRWLPDDFGKRDQIPWKKLLSAQDHQVWWYALQSAKRLRPSGLKSIATDVLNETKDRRKQQDLKELLDEIG